LQEHFSSNIARAFHGVLCTLRSAGQSLTEHPYVSVEVAEAELLCAISRRDSRRKKIANYDAELQLLRLNMQRVDALSKEEKTSNIKKMRLLQGR
jgi:hypothetical protein